MVAGVRPIIIPLNSARAYHSIPGGELEGALTSAAAFRMQTLFGSFGIIDTCQIIRIPGDITGNITAGEYLKGLCILRTCVHRRCQPRKEPPPRATAFAVYGSLTLTKCFAAFPVYAAGPLFENGRSPCP